MKSSFLDKLLNRLDRVGPEELQTQLQRLAGEKGFLETIFNTLQEGILVIDVRGRIMYVNHALERLLGIDADTALNQHVSQHLPDLDWKTLLADGQVVSRDIEVSYPEQRFLNFYVVPLDASRERSGGFAVIFHDLTASREKTREVIESEKLSALTLLAAGVAHELGNPLNSLHIHFQLMERDLKKIKDPQRDRLLESVDVARAEIARLDTIIRQFLRAIRPTAPERLPRDINELVRESLEFLRPEIADRDVVVETSFADGLPAVLVDAVQIKQAFYNVIKNALQAMGSGGILRVATGRNDTDLLISFADTGSGIPPAVVGRMFEPYFTTKESGTGLGLFIVSRIIREHGGELHFTSLQGQGTQARISLPLSERRVKMLSGERETTDPVEHDGETKVDAQVVE